MGFKIKGSLASTFLLSGATTISFSVLASYLYNPYVPGSYTPTHYVTASATGGGDGSLGNPWTLAEACSQAISGNVVQVGSGIYTGANTGSRNTPTFSPANSGTSINPIIFYAEYPAIYYTGGLRSQLRNGVSTNGSGCPVFGAVNQNHIWWDGFYVDVADGAASRSDTGPFTVFGGVGNKSIGCKVLRCHLVGVDAPWDDNYSGIRFEHADQWEIANCRVHGFDDNGGVGTHGWGILWYACSNYIVRNNEVYDQYGGIYPKGANAGVAVQNPGLIYRNYVHDTTDRGILIGGVNRDTGFLDIYQNLIVNPGRFAFSAIAYNDPAPLDVRIVNNTLYGATDSAFYIKAPIDVNTYDGCTYKNNIVVNCGHAFTGDTDTSYSQWADINRNTAFNNPLGHMNSQNFAWWQGTAGYDVNGHVRDPLFVNAGAGDFTLQGGSQEFNAGLDDLNLLGGGTGGSINRGCFILPGQTDVIGIEPEA